MKRVLVLLALAACGDDGAQTTPIAFGTMGPLVGSGGAGGFRFGVATAATQIEDMNTATDWYLWTARMPDGLGKDTFVDKAVMGYTHALDDLQLVKSMGMDSYRFSIEWARIEPVKDQIDEAAIAHYRDELMSLKALGIRPLVTLHHFSNPVWVADPRDALCTNGSSDTNLCGLGSPGGAEVVKQMGEHAALVAQRFGDIVDEWGTVNEPVNYLFAAYGAGIFPPGRSTLTALQTQFVPVVRDYIAAHAAMYDAIKANDTVDADGDGVAAAVGLSMSVQDWEPSRAGMPSQMPDDVAARDRFVYVFHYLFVDAIVKGGLDADLDGTIEEPHPEWAGRLDWLGLQYYFRAGVTGERALLPAPISVTPCFQGFDFGSCLQATSHTFCVPQMGYEFWADGLRGVLADFGKRYPDLPLVVTESGLATDVGARRSEAIVRVLEAIAKARDEDHVDVRGYYHWSLLDNFEWASGFAPHFGLYHVDLATYARTPTEAVDVYTAIATSRSVTSEQRTQYGGTGPMTPDTASADAYCAPN